MQPPIREPADRVPAGRAGSWWAALNPKWSSAPVIAVPASVRSSGGGAVSPTSSRERSEPPPALAAPRKAPPRSMSPGPRMGKLYPPKGLLPESGGAAGPARQTQSVRCPFSLGTGDDPDGSREQGIAGGDDSADLVGRLIGPLRDAARGLHASTPAEPKLGCENNPDRRSLPGIETEHLGVGAGAGGGCRDHGESLFLETACSPSPAGETASAVARRQPWPPRGLLWRKTRAGGPRGKKIG